MLCVCDQYECIMCVLGALRDCTRKWIGNAVQNISSSSVRSRDKIAHVRRTSVLSPEVDESAIQLASLLLVVYRCSVSPLEVCTSCSGQLVSSSLLDQVLVNCFSGVAQVCRDAAGKILLLSLHPNIIVYVENVVSLFSSPSTSSQKVRKCGSHNFLSQAI